MLYLQRSRLNNLKLTPDPECVTSSYELHEEHNINLADEFVQGPARSLRAKTLRCRILAGSEGLLKEGLGNDAVFFDGKFQRQP